MKIFKRVLFLLSLILVYVIVKELLEIYVLAKSFHPIAGYVLLITITAIVFYFILIPILKIIKMPRSFEPTMDRKEVPQALKQRIDSFKKNEYLIKSRFDFSTISYDEESYKRIVNALQIECENIRNRYVSRLFYSSSISQNGFIDAVLIFSASVNLVKEIFILYNGRVSNKDLLSVGKRIYYSIAIGGSEGVEYATEEIISKFTTEGLKSIPFVDKIISSIADGFINAVLLTRVSLITENYCRMIYIESEKDLFPSPVFIFDTTKHITSDMTDKINSTIKTMVKDKVINFPKLALNPAGYVLSESIGKMTSKTTKMTSDTIGMIKDGVEYGVGVVTSPFGTVASQFANFVKKRKEKKDSKQIK